ncbi:hypothetical protein BSQ44_24155 [Aquibium oceanicum]|uniref:Uncharacterized protein n=1 Tax=Aquibium oceanicum TaxID=1670800 RepID=A0A1L3SXP6_9HYPH|nr:hypothetical protein BSQ44_24155 [Aquibium oceanicum]
MTVDNHLKSYWSALCGLRRCATEKTRRSWLTGPFKLAITLEKDPRLRARLQNIYEQELSKPA